MSCRSLRKVFLITIRLIILYSLSIIGLIASAAADSEILLGPALSFPDQHEISIWWHTISHPSAGYVVEYGTTPLQMDKKVFGQTIHEASEGKYFFIRLSGLSPSTTYFYRLTNGIEKDDIKSFTTLDDPKLETASLRIGIFGDTQYGYTIFRDHTVKTLSKFQLNALLPVGDIVHEGDKYPLWKEQFYGPAKELLAKVPLFPNRGNHDGESSLAHIMYPFVGGKSWYAFYWGQMALVVLDSNDELYFPGTEQYQWAVKEFNNPKWKQAKYRLVAFHHLPYTNLWDNGREGYDGEVSTRKWLVPLIEGAGANVVLNGHAHCYSHGIKDNEYIQGQKVHYFTFGGGGADLDRVVVGHWPFILRSDSIYHVGIMEFAKGSLTVKVIDTMSNEVVDVINI